MSEKVQHKDNSGVLFWNSEKWIALKEGRPDMSGECTVEGKRLRVAAWHKNGQDGIEFLSLAFSVPQAPQAPQAKLGCPQAQPAKGKAQP